MTWQPSAPITNLRQRAEMMAQIRTFFAERDVLEVETPLLSHGTVTDVHLDAFVTPFEFDACGDKVDLFLQTSPEFAMKRLLAGGSGAIYQICKAFRNESVGRFHNPEFSMLEWYRPDFDDKQLMSEVGALVKTVLDVPCVESMSYQQAFIKYLDLDPLTASLSSLQVLATGLYNDEWIASETDRDVLLQWLFSEQIEPKLGRDFDGHVVPCFVYDFPSTQASLAKISEKDDRVAHRFELYYKGIELANGFYELQDASEQRLRFEQDNVKRQALGKPPRPIDNNLIDALVSGLPNCSGVALGLDRLMMCKVNAQHINEIISFDYERA